jgi:hypothetical protein
MGVEGRDGKEAKMEGKGMEGRRGKGRDGEREGIQLEKRAW